MSRARTRYDIDHYQPFNNSFMSEKEITEMYKLLKGHMYMKYGRYDDEIIHRSILKGLNVSHQYNPAKASKLVWFQTILWSTYIYEIDPKYNVRIKHHYSLDWMNDEADDNMTVISEASNLSNDFGNNDAERNEFVGDIVDVIMSGDYPMLRMRIDGLTYAQIIVKTGLCNTVIYNNLCEERIRLKLETSHLEGDDILLGRMKFRDGSKGGRFGRVGGKKIHPRNCVVCSKEFIPNGKMIKFCSDNCRLRRASLQQLEYCRKKAEKKRLK